MEVDFGSASLLVLCYATLSSFYIQHVIAQAIPGLRRLTLYLPLIIANILVPLLFQRQGLLVFGRITWTYLVAWLATNKGLGLCLNRGILASVPQQGTNWTTGQFVALYLLPILPAKEHLEGLAKVKELGRLLIHSITKLGFLLVCYAFMAPEDEDLEIQNTLANGFGLYFFLAYLFNSTSFLALLIFDIPTRDNFDFPFLATSLSDFWGRRWNTMTAKVLRTLSYDLVVDGEWIHQEAQQASRTKVTELRRAAGIFAVFTLSGIIHEVFLWSLGGSVDCEWFAYFFLQAPLLLIEKQIKNFFSKYCGIKSIPKPISILLFFSLNFFMGMMFFVPQARRSGGDELALLVRSTVLGY